MNHRTMRRFPLIFGLLLIVALTVRDLYGFFVPDEGVRYFSSDPRRLLYVVLLGVAGGIAALMISRSSPGSQRKLKLAALGGFGVFVICVVGLYAYYLTRAAPTITEACMWAWVAAALLSFMVVAATVWLEFRHVRRQA